MVPLWMWWLTGYVMAHRLSEIYCGSLRNVMNHWGMWWLTGHVMAHCEMWWFTGRCGGSMWYVVAHWFCDVSMGDVVAHWHGVCGGSLVL